MKPAVGQIVLYTSERTSHSGPAVNGVVETFPAIIVKASSLDGVVGLRVFRDDAAPPLYFSGVAFASTLTVGRWSWPPRDESGTVG